MKQSEITSLHAMFASSYLPAAKEFVEKSPKPVYDPKSERFNFNERQRIYSLIIPKTNKLLLGPLVINTDGLHPFGYISAFKIRLQGNVLMVAVQQHVNNTSFNDLHVAVVMYITDSDIPGMVAKCMYNHAKAEAWKSAVAKLGSVWSSTKRVFGSVSRFIRNAPRKVLNGSVSRFIRNAPRKVLNKVPLFQSKETRSAIKKTRVDEFSKRQFRQIPKN